MSSLRIFVAVDVADELRDSISRLQRRLQSTRADLKIVERENLHVTLRFIGEVDRAKVDEVMRRLSNLRFNSFKIHLRGVGVFPDLRRPRVIWVGIEEGAQELARLQGEVVRLTWDIGEREDREFTPHITVARVRYGDVAELAQVLREYSNFDFGVQLVDSVKLKRSTLTPRGPVYEDLLVVRGGAP
jgi:2'-5' RNA ligase